MHFIPYSSQDLGEDDIAAVVEVLRSPFITQGPRVTEFENVMTAYCGCRYAVAVANGTAALHIACLALGLGPKDLLWTSPISFVASANCARYVGADVDFVDVDPLTGNIDVPKLRDKLRHAKVNGRLPAAVVAVHFAGRVCPMPEIAELADEFDFKIIEDAAHALGAQYRQGENVGNCMRSSFTTLSFHPVKSITTAEGGMVLTNDEELAGKARMLATHGISRSPSDWQFPGEAGYYYEQLALGFNFRLTELQAALGISQLRKLDSFITRRREIARAYEKELAGLPIDLPPESDESAWHLYPIHVKATGKSRDEVFRFLRSNQIGVNVHYLPIHLQPYYRTLGFGPGNFPCAEEYSRRVLTIPIFPRLQKDDFARVVSVLRNAFG